MNGETVFYATIAIVGTIAIIGMALWIRRRDRKMALSSQKMTVPSNPSNPKMIDGLPIDAVMAIYRIEENLQEWIPIGDKRAIVVELDEKLQPKIVAFRSKGGKGKFVTAFVIKSDGLNVLLRHRFYVSIFKRQLIS